MCSCGHDGADGSVRRSRAAVVLGLGGGYGVVRHREVRGGQLKAGPMIWACVPGASAAAITAEDRGLAGVAQGNWISA